MTLNPATGSSLGSLVDININSSGTSLVDVHGPASLAGTLDVNLDTTGITYSRFITHAKYLALRYINHSQIEEQEDNIFTLNPNVVEKTKEVIGILNDRLNETYGQSLSEYEKMYLTIHICRLLKIS